MLAEFVDPAQHLCGGFSAGDECFGLLVLSEMQDMKVEFKRPYSAMTDKPDKIPTILSRELLRAPDMNQSGHASTVAVSFL
jgi:hypothetical protein